jgi:hypothetical protein
MNDIQRIHIVEVEFSLIKFSEWAYFERVWDDCNVVSLFPTEMLDYRSGKNIRKKMSHEGTTAVLRGDKVSALVHIPLGEKKLLVDDILINPFTLGKKYSWAVGSAGSSEKTVADHLATKKGNWELIWSKHNIEGTIRVLGGYGSPKPTSKQTNYESLAFPDHQMCLTCLGKILSDEGRAELKHLFGNGTASAKYLVRMALPGYNRHYWETGHRHERENRRAGDI